ncbi:hypothetical protein ACSNOI_16740 [Actinomadura kijaniata]|uniref:hypothetical protein n=1 Tax=Actinomadura kijaniata TaxID=46161 RepID=UPI003F1BEAEB
MWQRDARLRVETTGELVADGGTVMVVDADGATGTPPGSPSPWEAPGEDWLTIVPNGVRVTGLGYRHTVEVRLQLWDAEVWDRTATGRLYVHSGCLDVVEVFGDRGAALYLGVAESWWQLRARARVSPLDWTDPTADDDARDVFLLQLWPADPPPETP